MRIWLFLTCAIGFFTCAIYLYASAIPAYTRISKTIFHQNWSPLTQNQSMFNWPPDAQQYMYILDGEGQREGH